MANWGQLAFQDAATPVMFMLVKFHDYTMGILTLIVSMVAYAMFSLLKNKLTCRNILEAQVLETIWTIAPVFLLIALALPSLRILYLMDEVPQPKITVKAMGHQWYWSYQYSDEFSHTNQLSFDSYMKPENTLLPGEYRLLEVDNRVILPINTEIRFLITAADVLHSWAVPALGAKMDAVPGRLNQLGLLIFRPGVYYGQCSEICGANHSFMPIALEAVTMKTYQAWMLSRPIDTA